MGNVLLLLILQIGILSVFLLLFYYEEVVRTRVID